MTNYELTGNKIVEAKQYPLKIAVSPGQSHCLACFFTAETITEVLDHDCDGPVDALKYSASETLEEPNRFDPFKALDTFLACIREMEEHTVGFGGDIETMRNQVYALRAYITGVEKSNES